MTNTIFPQTIFTTQRRFNDYGANDMRYGDMSAEKLRKEFDLENISNVVDPYMLTRLAAFDNPQSRFAGVYGRGRRREKVSVQECASLLFQEMQITSLPYSWAGPYRHLINQMLRHFQHSVGTPFCDPQLNAAYRQKLDSDYATNNTRRKLQESIASFIDYKNKGFPQEKIADVKSALRITVLPMFDSLILDKINGMGITVHGVYATKIDILQLDVNEKGWRATVRFTGQDHFGLDEEDIRNTKFNQFQFFKIWFVLQRFNRFGFRPFFTNMEAVVTIGENR